MGNRASLFRKCAPEISPTNRVNGYTVVYISEGLILFGRNWFRVVSEMYKVLYKFRCAYCSNFTCPRSEGWQARSPKRDNADCSTARGWEAERKRELKEKERNRTGDIGRDQDLCSLPRLNVSLVGGLSERGNGASSVERAATTRSVS